MDKNLGGASGGDVMFEFQNFWKQKEQEIFRACAAFASQKKKKKKKENLSFRVSLQKGTKVWIDLHIGKLHKR